MQLLIRPVLSNKANNILCHKSPKMGNELNKVEICNAFCYVCTAIVSDHQRCSRSQGVEILMFLSPHCVRISQQLGLPRGLPVVYWFWPSQPRASLRKMSRRNLRRTTIKLCLKLLRSRLQCSEVPTCTCSYKIRINIHFQHSPVLYCVSMTSTYGGCFSSACRRQ